MSGFSEETNFNKLKIVKTNNIMDCIKYLPKEICELIYQWYCILDNYYYPQIMYTTRPSQLRVNPLNHLCSFPDVYRPNTFNTFWLPFNRIIYMDLGFGDGRQHYVRKGINFFVKLKHKKIGDYIYLNVDIVENGIYKFTNSFQYLLSVQPRASYRFK